jgi:hypothetical protein
MDAEHDESSGAGASVASSAQSSSPSSISLAASSKQAGLQPVQTMVESAETRYGLARDAYFSAARRGGRVKKELRALLIAAFDHHHLHEMIPSLAQDNYGDLFSFLIGALTVCTLLKTVVSRIIFIKHSLGRILAALNHFSKKGIFIFSMRPARGLSSSREESLRNAGIVLGPVLFCSLFARPAG